MLSGLIFFFFLRETSGDACTHCPGSHGHPDAGEEGQVVAGVDAVPHGRQQEGGGRGVDRTALVAHSVRKNVKKQET